MELSRRAIALLSALVAGLWSPACGGAPTAPDGSAAIVGFEISCAPSLFVGQTSSCVGVAHRSDGSNPDVTHSVTWSSSDTSVASMSSSGAMTGRAAGQVTATGSYLGKLASAQVTVRFEDVLNATASAQQGSFRVGTTASMWLLGFYGVASADTGILTLVITDQNGAIVSTTEPKVVPKGGDSFILMATFTVPADATLICRAAVLQIGALVLTETGGEGLHPCVSVSLGGSVGLGSSVRN